MFLYGICNTYIKYNICDVNSITPFMELQNTHKETPIV